MLGFGRWRRDAHDRTWGELGSAWMDGELGPAEAARFSAHAATCDACRARLRAYRQLGTGLDGLTQAVAAPPAYRIFEQVGAARGTLLGVRVPSRLALAASAAVLVAGGAASPPV